MSKVTKRLSFIFVNYQPILKDMRKYENISPKNEQAVRRALRTVADDSSSVKDYREAFKVIGQELGKVIVSKYKKNGKTVIACPNEDADWLVEGIMEALNDSSISLAVYWSDRMTVKDDKNGKMEISPIRSSYEEHIEGCQTLIIAKSIISTSCVIRTQLTRLIGEISPKQIIIVAPVMYKYAEFNLRKEFPDNISSRFEFVDFAIDDERDDNNIIKPGIGGYITKRLGLGNSIKDNNSYIPKLVMERAAKHYAERSRDSVRYEY